MGLQEIAEAAAAPKGKGKGYQNDVGGSGVKGGMRVA